MPEAPEGAVARREQITDGGQCLIHDVSATDTAERIDPTTGLHQRDANEIAAALPRAPRERDERAERRQVAGRVIDDLRGEVLRAIEPSAKPSVITRLPPSKAVRAERERR